jgi:hypothetical protein
MIPIPNQPVNFEDDPFINPWVAEHKYKQLVNQGDVTQFQLLTSTQQNSENLLENPTFDQVFAPWQVGGLTNINSNGTGWKLEVFGANKIAQQAIQYNRLVVGSYYYIEVKIKQSQYGYVKIFLGDNLVAQKQAGTHIIYGQCTTNTSFSMLAVPFSGKPKTIIEVEYAIVYDTPIANHRFVIEEMDGTQVAEIPAIANYLNAPFVPDTDVAQFVKSFLTMSVDWQTQGVSNGCYRIGVCDADVNTNAQCGVINSEFEAKTGVDWGANFSTPTASFAWAISLGGMTLTSLTSSVRFNATAIQTGTLTQSVLTSGIVYDYSLRVQGSSGESITVKMGTQTSSHNTNGTDQTFTGQITADGTDLVLEFISTAGSKSMTIEHFRLEATNASLVPDYKSNPFELLTDHDRTVVVNASTSNDAFGMEYDDTIWTPRLRMKGYTAPSDTPYKNDRESLTTSVGNRKNYYLRRRKSRVLVVDQEPEFIHDWLSLLCGYDHVYVDNIEYFVDDDAYNPIVWNKFRSFGATEINISEKIQDVAKVRENKEKNGTMIDTGDIATDGVLGRPPRDGQTDGDKDTAIMTPKTDGDTNIITSPSSSQFDDIFGTFQQSKPR